MEKKLRNRGSALIITIVVVVIITMMMVYFLEKIVPVSRNVKGVENTTVAYYKALSGIESGLFDMNGTDPASETALTTVGTAEKKYEYSLSSLTDKIPLDGEGNSDLSKVDLRWNRLGPGEPVQLAYNNNMDPNNITFAIRVPNLDGDCSNHFGIAGGSKIIVNWTLSGNGKTLFANTGISADEINSNAANSPAAGSLAGNGECDGGYGTRFRFAPGASSVIKSNGLDAENNPQTFVNFYNNIKASCAGWKCSIKLSIVNELKTIGGANIPYLEYRLTSVSNPIPNQYAIIDSAGYAYGFKRYIRRDVRQTTTNEALDFTIFQ